MNSTGHHSLFLAALLFGSLVLSAAENEVHSETNPALGWPDREFHSFGLAMEGHNLVCQKSEGVWRIETTGTDPYLQTAGLAKEIDPHTAYRVMFQYRSDAELDRFQVLFKTHSGLQHLNQTLPTTENWRWHGFDLREGKGGIGEAIQWLRFDFGSAPEKTFEIRDLRLVRRFPKLDPATLNHLPFGLKDSGNDVQVKTHPDGSWKVTSTGGDPHVMTTGIAENLRADTPYLLAFEYQAPPESEPLTLYYKTESEMVRNQSLETSPTEDWTWLLHDFSKGGSGLGEDLQWLRLDFGSLPDVTYRIRNCRLIPATHELRQRAILGDQYRKLSSFGIAVGNMPPQKSAVETARHDEGQNIAVTLSTYRHLDLDAETKRLSHDPSAKPPVPLAPRIVAGEGEHPDNHTVIRILSPYQVCETQFLAYPPEIRGGVGVETGTDAQGTGFIVAYPLRSVESRELRLFSPAGGIRGTVAPPDDLEPPFIVAVGNFVPEQKGDEIAVASRYHSGSGQASVHVLSPAGELISTIEAPTDVSASHQQEFHLSSTNRALLLLQNLSHKQAHQLLPIEDARTIDFRNSPLGSSLLDTLHDDREFSLGGPENLVSTLYPWQDGKLGDPIDVGRMENTFWFDPQEVHNGSHSTWGEFPDGRYIKNIKYNYLGSAQYWSPLARSGEIEARSYEEWTEGIDWDRVFAGEHRNSLDEYASGVPKVWNASFSHRWNVNVMAKLSAQVDPDTQLPRYLLLDRANESTGGGYFGKRLFDYGTQNFEQESVDQLYTYAQRAFYRKLAPLYREDPEMTVAVEPNHENEIVSGGQSVGDYHPKSLEGFYHYLITLYQDLETINKRLGTTFTATFFDAPRGLLRGEWDRYDTDNELFRQWVEYNRIQVYRRVGTSYREALLAGFPPELIKSHQIPDSYVFGSIVGISEGQVRISPIDWLLTTGAGFGFSRYGTYYDRKHNIGQGAHSSGFDGMLVGEYASLNPSPEKALNQLLYLRDRGVSALHVMWWPEGWDKGFNDAQAAALREMIANHDRPKPGLAGGIQQVRVWRGEDRDYEIASLGTGPEHTGLLKSLRADGSFEGSIYVVPFHAHVGIERLRSKPELTIGESPVVLAEPTDLRQGTVIETTFRVSQLPESGALRLALKHAEVELGDSARLLADLSEGQHVRVVHKVPLILDGLTLELSSPEGTATIEDLQVIHHQDQSINLTRGIMEGQRHQGGVTFAILPQ